jgi:hypothetical protein
VAVLAVIHKTCFERGFDAGYDGFVDVALALLAALDFDFVVGVFVRRRWPGGALQLAWR